MNIDPALRELLVCPSCHASFTDGDEELVCTGCGLAYPVRDGIPVLPGPEFAITRNLIRTAPLWALRTRNRLMHDGLSFTKQEAIQRHGNQAAGVRDRYNALTDQQRNLVLTFLESL